MFKRFCLALVCCGLSVCATAADRFIIKYKPTTEQSRLLLQGGAKAQIAAQQMMKPLSKSQIKSLSKLADGVTVKEINQIATGAHVIITGKNLDEIETKSFIDNVSKRSDVKYIEEDRILKPLAIRGNLDWGWDMYRAGEFTPQPTWNGDNFSNAWAILEEAGYGVGSNVVVGVIDTGYTPHPNFLNDLLPLTNVSGAFGYQLISDCRISGNCSPSTPSASAVNYPYQANALDLGDYVSQSDIDASNGFFTNDCLQSRSSWHGSHVTGTIAATGYTEANPTYIAGGAYNARVVPVRVLGKCGGYSSDVTNGMLWAAGFPVLSNDMPVPLNPNPVQVINMSLGGGGGCSNAMQDAIDTINSVSTNGTIIVVAAGNEANDISYHNPSSCSGIITVAAKGPTDSLAFYSNHGATTIAASGGDSEVAGCSGSGTCDSKVYSTIWTSLQGYDPNSGGGFAFYQGTSMATPHVTAAVADIISVLKSKNEAYTLYGIIQILQQTADSYNNCNSNGCATGGALNVASAIIYTLQNSVPTAPPAPAPLVSVNGGAGAGGGGGGGCSAIKNGDDYSLILLLLIGSTLYLYRRRKILKTNK